MRARAGGFTLLELLVVLAVASILAALAVTALGAIRERSEASQCGSQLRQIGAAFQLFAGDHGGALPRSSHSAAGHRERPWQRELLPYLGFPGTSAGDLERASRGMLHCPSHEAEGAASYALNVYFELDGEIDDYAGAPQEWRTLQAIPRPALTVLLCETASGADHVMPHFWGDEAPPGAVAHSRHSGESQYLFADGHAELLELQQVYDPPQNVDRFHPAGRARAD